MADETKPNAFPTGAELLSMGLVAIATLVWMSIALLFVPMLQHWAKEAGGVLPSPIQLMVEVSVSAGLLLWLTPAVPLAIGLLARQRAFRERAVVGASLALIAFLVIGVTFVGLSAVAFLYR